MNIDEMRIKYLLDVEIKKFDIGKTYSFRMPGDKSITGHCKIINRTNKTITFLDVEDKKVKKARVYVYGGVESCMPLGNYSKAPVIRADRYV